ncbi:DUF3299 domain-containing protein [Crateriforma conspicua]|uniref:DUF3299 domain-containing protein n=1 Tax=Crateriforma conspicua TaxID=2527996 RepID=A0A5C5XR62_9PLAN|nr:DUF3299 domain-containing protein [Crateriforma conspicua]QDV66301.1 hypothetical protein Mal65_54770 [Crateriforma conspicua]TWT65707.1 hypothetical protein Pan14r_52560 [Crateriforma conspicua]
MQPNIVPTSIASPARHAAGSRWNLLAACLTLTAGSWIAATVTAEDQSRPSRAAIRGAQVDNEGRELAEDRKSSQARLAKGDINFDDLKFDIEKGETFDEKQLTDRVKFLNGRTVELRGYILPSTLFRMTNIDQFVLVRDNQECCFGPGAALFDCVMVKMTDGNTTDFVTRPVTVRGKFKIDAKSYRYPGGRGPDGASHLAVFEIEGVEVR